MLGAPVAHAPILRFDFLQTLKKPIDGGRTLRGRRLLGDNKPWRGALVMAVGVEAATLALHRVPAREAAGVFAAVAAIHLPINLAGYALGARDTPI